MKYWELQKILQDEGNVLTELYNSKMLKYYEDYEDIVRNQQREILDSTIPQITVLCALKKSIKHFYVDKDIKNVYSYQNKHSIGQISIFKLYEVTEVQTILDLLESTNILTNNLSTSDIEPLERGS